MIAVSIATLQSILQASLIVNNDQIVNNARIGEHTLIEKDVLIDAVSTDTRTLSNGALFVALVGERFDGHNFVHIAKNSGASVLLVSKTVDVDLPQLVVADTKIALGLLGAWVKAQCDLKTIALTGSCGKTTVKEMLAAILSQKGQTRYTVGNFNNEVGVPLTLLTLQPSDKYAVIELGANHVGEIAYTTALVHPDIVIVTNVGEAHLEGFGSFEGVIKAKGEIFQGLRDDGLAIVNLDSWGEQAWTSALNGKRVKTTTVTDKNADFRAQDISPLGNGCYQFDLVSPSGIYSITLNLPGQHNVANAVLASAAALNIDGITLEDVASGLFGVGAVKGRGAITFPRKGLRLIDDSYNASLPAMNAAVDLLDSFDGEKIMVLADMAEMGEHVEFIHQQVAKRLSQSAIQTVLTYGPVSALISDRCGGLHFENKNALIAHVVELVKTKLDVSVLVKGANGMKMSEVVTAIEEAVKC